MFDSTSRRGMYELQMKQADRQAKEHAVAKDRQTLEVLKRCVDYLAKAGRSARGVRHHCLVCARCAVAEALIC